MSTGITQYQAKYYAHELRRSYANDHVGKLAGLLFDAQVEPKPHQIDAALFALQTPFLKGVIFADEVGLGKTIEAGIVITQYWSERKRQLLIIAPSSLRQQWQQELLEKFNLPSELVDGKNFESALSNTGAGGRSRGVLICSYEFVLRHEVAMSRKWDLVVCDEAHRLRNNWTSHAKVAEAVSHVLEHTGKTLLLTATPLQNRLEELYGLVSTFYPEYFHSMDAFRERYIKGREFGDDDDLKDRVATITKRTLRQDASKYIHFTKRLPLTAEFESSPEEQRLYDLVNTYLQREHLYAFTASQRHLSALIIRKRLGSSTYAVASTLENIANRLAEELASGQRQSGGNFLLASEEDLTSDELEDIDDSPAGDSDDLTSEQAAHAAHQEVLELRHYAELARSITVNQKALKLNEALDQGFEKLAEIGAPQKAIIFTDSTKTQEYIARSLTEAGRGEGLVLFNGQNNSPQSTAIYQAWLKANQGTDLITGIASADRRKALVDYFRDQGTIMIATEAASEGINLQFCSMIVNYDLPWNPQRVEQRIGRCHRFGQKHNVVVVNFSNKGNVAEQRILELLSNKFHLFESVFGASDQVLGSIEDGLDFEKQITDILNRCHTSAEIQKAFDKLDEQYAGDISREMQSTRSKVFDNLDPHVQDRLKSYDQESGAVLNRFERLLLAVTRFELRDVAQFSADGRQFALTSSPVAQAPVGQYFFKSEPLPHAHQYRYSSPLAQYALDQAVAEPTPPAAVTFSIGASARPSAQAKSLVGQHGTLTVKEITFRMKAGEEKVTESYILAAAITDEGKHLDAEYVNELLDLAATTTEPVSHPIDTAPFTADLAEQQEVLSKEVQQRNSRYYDQQEELYYRNKEDRKAESEAKIRDFKKKEREARKKAKVADDPMEQLRFKKEARTWAHKAEAEDDRARSERRELDDKLDEYLDLIEQSLKGTQDVTHLFDIEWKVIA